MKTKGRILKDRIKQKGFTQAVFADACGISLSALKKYITDELPYSIALLEIFSEKLDCSTAYLLGESETTMPELHDLKEQTHLSDNAIATLVVDNNDYTREINNGEDEIKKRIAERELVTLSWILEDDELLYQIEKLLYFDEKDAYFAQFGNNCMDMCTLVTVGDICMKANDVLGALTMTIIERLNLMRKTFWDIEDKSTILTREVDENAKKCTRKWLNS